MALTQDFKASIQSGGPATGGASASQPMTPDQFQQWAQPTPEGGYFNNVADAAKQGLSEAEAGFQQGTEKGAGLSGAITGAVRTVGGAAGAVLSPITGGFKTVQDSLGKAFPNTANLVNHLIQGAGDKISDIPAVQKFAMENPHAEQVIGDLMNIIGLGVAPEAAEATAEGVGSAASKVGEVAQPLIEKAGALGEKAVNAVSEGISPSLNPAEATRQVIQGETGDLPAAQRALSSLDTTGVKTYADLQAKIKAAIPDLSKQVDAEYAKDTSGGHSIKSFEQTVGEGKAAVKVNYVKEAIQQLKDYYTKTGDAKGLSEMKALENKARINGLTYKDINDLARLHGSELNGFNANGELSSGLTKQAAENTRAGLKTTARAGLGNDAAKALDAKLSDLYDTKALIDKMVEKVNARSAKTPKQGVIAKAGQVIAKGPMKTIGEAMGAIPESGTLDPLKLEAKLQANLKALKGGK